MNPTFMRCRQASVHFGWMPHLRGKHNNVIQNMNDLACNDNNLAKLDQENYVVNMTAPSFKQRMIWNSLNRSQPKDLKFQKRVRTNGILKDSCLSSFSVVHTSVVCSPILTLNITGKILQSYHINLPEGMLRNLFSVGVRSAPCSNIILTKLQWDDVAALPSILQPFLQNRCTDNINIFGPPGTSNFIRKFITFAFSAFVCDKIWPRLCINEQCPNSVDDDVIQMHMREVKPWGIKTCNRFDYSGPICIYVITLPPSVPPLVSLEKLSEHGIKWRRQIRPKNFKDFDEYAAYRRFFKNITNGEIGIHPTAGYEIRPEDVYNTDREPVIRRVAVVDCPTVAYLEPLKSELSIRVTNQTAPLLAAVLHLSPTHVFQHEDYQQWLSEFPSSCSHFAASASLQSHVIPVATKLNTARAALNFAAPKLFPMHDNKNILMDIVHSSDPILDSFFQRDTCYTVKLSADDLHRLPLKYNKVQACCEEYMDVIRNLQIPPSNPDVDAVYPRLIVLGSGSSDVGYRNQSSYLLRVDRDTSLLIDCGENTLFQLHNHFGPCQVQTVLSTIRVIFISHKHSDHVMGTVSVIKSILARQTNIEEKDGGRGLCVIAPLVVKNFLDGYFQQYRSASQVWICAVSNSKRLKQVEQTLRVNQFLPVKVDHGVLTFGLVVQGSNWKVAYSADTFPMCRNLIAKGKDADLLIHDSLYTDEVDDMKARYKLHSTKQDAIATAQAMNARAVMLTHFSPTTPIVLPDLTVGACLYAGTVLCAIDHMEVGLSPDQIEEFPTLHKRMLHMFRDQLGRYSQRKERYTLRAQAVKQRLSETYQQIADY